MIRKIFTPLTAFLLSLSVSFAQDGNLRTPDVASVEGPSVTFTTEQASNSWLEFYIQSFDHNAWIDLNGNRQMDSGEFIDDTDIDEKQSFKVNHQIITIYGNIKDLDLRDCSLTSVSFKAQNDLEELRLMRNKLSGVWDFSNLPALRIVNLDKNQIEEANFQGCKALSELYVNNNNLSKINVDGCTNLRFLMMANNSLKTLELRGLSNLANFKANANQLTSVTLENLGELSYVQLQNNKISTVEIEGCPMLSSVGIYANRIKKGAMQKLFEALPDRSSEEYAGQIKLFDSSYPKQEGNQCTTTMVESATAKHWDVQDDAGSAYSGIDDSQDEDPIPDTEHPSAPLDGASVAFTAGVGEGGEISFRIVSVDNTAWIDLNANRRMDVGEYLEDAPNGKDFTLEARKTDLVIYGAVKELSVEEAQISKIEFKDQSNLAKLGLLRNDISMIDLSKLPQLQELELEENGLTEISLDGLKNLESVSLGRNELTALSFKDLPKLRVVFAYRNELALVHVENCPNLARLQLQYNKLQPEALKNFVNGLPSMTEEAPGEITIISASTEESEGNRCTKSVVRQALKKNWKFKMSDGSDYLGIEDEEEVEVAPIDGPSITFSTVKDLDEPIEFYLASVNFDAWIDLNGNKKFDEGEYIDDTDRLGLRKITLTNETNTIYGELIHIIMEDCMLSGFEFKGQKSIEEINLSSNLIFGLLEFKDMPKLTSISLSGNQLDELRFENCPELSFLGAGRNSLTQIDVNMLPKLEQLYVYNNQLEELSLEGLQNLSYLDVTSNKIRRLTLENLPMLAEAFLGSNAIEDCHIEGCSSLGRVTATQNGLVKDKMDRFIENLPDRSGKQAGVFFVLNHRDLPNETNSCTKKQVDAAKSKNWLVRLTNGEDYEGSDDNGLLDIAAEGAIYYDRETESLVVITIPALIGAELRVFNEGGQLVYADRIHDAQETVDLSHLPQGVYLVLAGDVSYKIIR